MHYLFDGSFDGLMTLVFETYRKKDEVEAVSEYMGADSLLETCFIASDVAKASRIKGFMARSLGEDFVFMVKAAFLSRRESRFRAIVRTLHLSCGMGKAALDLLDDSVLDFVACQREVQCEAHRFNGLIRLRQMQDGSMLGVFAPRNNVLPLILPHFTERFPEERLLLYDENRRLAGLSGEGKTEFFEAAGIMPQETGDEEELQDLWRVFFDHLAIRERVNLRLQRQHLPKYTWKNLTEMG